MAGVGQRLAFDEIGPGIADVHHRPHRNRGTVGERDGTLLAAAVDGVDRFVEPGVELVAVDRSGDAGEAIARQPLPQGLEVAVDGVGVGTALEDACLDLSQAG